VKGPFARALVQAARNDAAPFGAKARAVAKVSRGPSAGLAGGSARVAMAAALAGWIACVAQSAGAPSHLVAPRGDVFDAPPAACSQEGMVRACAESPGAAGTGGGSSSGSSGGGWSASSSG
jgi:hypothetical protein